MEVYGTATEAMLLNGGQHITNSLGSRSRSQIPAPYRDFIFGDVMKPDYEAAEDTKYVTPPGSTVDVSATVSSPADSWPSSEEWELKDTKDFKLQEPWPDPDPDHGWHPPAGVEADTDSEDEDAERHAKAPLRRL